MNHLEFVVLDVGGTHEKNPDCPMRLAWHPTNQCWYCVDCGLAIVAKRLDVVEKEKKKEWFWHEEPPGAPIYYSEEDKRNDRRIKELKSGAEVLVQNLLLGWCRAILKKDTDSDWYAEDRGSIYSLYFCEERKCWVSPMALNKLAIQKTEEQR